MAWLQNLRMMKEKSGLTTKEIALESGLPEPTLEKIFAGKTKDPKLSTLNLLVQFFGCTLDDLIEGQQTEKAPTLSGERQQLMDIIPYLSDEAVHAMLILAAQAGRQP